MPRSNLLVLRVKVPLLGASRGLEATVLERSVEKARKVCEPRQSWNIAGSSETCRGDESMSGSETMARYQMDIMRTGRARVFSLRAYVVSSLQTVRYYRRHFWIGLAHGTEEAGYCLWKEGAGRCAIS